MWKEEFPNQPQSNAFHKEMLTLKSYQEVTALCTTAELCSSTVPSKRQEIKSTNRQTGRVNFIQISSLSHFNCDSTTCDLSTVKLEKHWYTHLIRIGWKWSSANPWARHKYICNPIRSTIPVSKVNDRDSEIARPWPLNGDCCTWIIPSLPSLSYSMSANYIENASQPAEYK